MSIRAARPDDLALMVEIERAAGEMFRSLGSWTSWPTTTPARSRRTGAPMPRSGRAFVSVGADDRPVAYLLVDLLDGTAHIEQVSVHPDHARRGLGRELIETRSSWARACGLPALTLTTYVDVPLERPLLRAAGVPLPRRGRGGPRPARRPRARARGGPRCVATRAA